MTRTLPRNIHLSDGRYYYVVTKDRRAQWIPLTKDLETSKTIAARIIGGKLQVVDLKLIERALRTSWRAARWRSGKYGIDFDLTWETVLQMADRHGWCCAVTAFPFSLQDTKRGRASPLAPSIDRIRADRGYVVGNVRLVCVATNYALNEWGDDFFAHLATAFLRVRGAIT